MYFEPIIGTLHLELEDLSLMLDMLKVPEMKALMQEFHLPVKGRKQAMITAIKDHARCQRSIKSNFTDSVGSNITSIVTERYLTH